MKVEIDEGRKLVIVWLCSDEDKSLAQPIIGPVDKVIIPEQIPANMTHRKTEKAERRRP